MNFLSWQSFFETNTRIYLQSNGFERGLAVLPSDSHGHRCIERLYSLSPIKASPRHTSDMEAAESMTET